MADTGWQKEIAELRRRQALAAEMGGPERVARQRARGKLTVRERIAALLDQGSFREWGSLAGEGQYGPGGELTGFRASSCIGGRGLIERRPVVVSADDFTVRGGSSESYHHEKNAQLERMAAEYGLPLVRLLDGTGGGGSVAEIEKLGATYVPYVPGFEQVVANLGRVPVVALGLGPVAGLGAARLVASHYSVMVRGLSQMFTAGPPVVEAAGEKVTADELGGAQLHAGTGSIDDVVDTEQEALQRARRFLGYLPSCSGGAAARVACEDPPDRVEEWLDAAIPRDRRWPYEIRPILEAVLDRGSFFEIGRAWGRPVVTGLARLEGWPVAILASDPGQMGGTWTAAVSRKMTRLVELAETFRLPVVHFVDVGGFTIGSQAERAGTIRDGTRAIATIYQSTVPWCAVILRRAFGVAGAGMMNHARFRYRIAWPSGDWGSLPPEGGIEAAFKAQIAAAEDPQAAKQQIRERLERLRSPFRSAERFFVEEIVPPSETRRWLCEFAQLAAGAPEAATKGFHYRP
ncbi:MAG TPA: carboxyl transferase domain-containing protein [Steroidobacteraceae bacterium]|nr:carboxyl transferase domain-containing protein [Steroidobacteraceae bacterium]